MGPMVIDKGQPIESIGSRLHSRRTLPGEGKAARKLLATIYFQTNSRFLGTAGFTLDRILEAEDSFNLEVVMVSRKRRLFQ